MKTLLCIVSALLCVGFAFAADTGGISGVVLDQNTTLPIAGATVIAINGVGVSAGNESGRAQTNNSGEYAITGLTPGGYAVFARSAAYPPEIYPQPVMVEANNVTSGVNFRLRLPTRQGAITGKVVDAATGSPIQGAVVIASPSITLEQATLVPARAVTNAQGVYQISQLDPGDYEVTASHAGYETSIYPVQVTVTAGQTKAGIDFSLKTASSKGAIAGKITDAVTGRPLGGVLVRANASTIIGIHGQTITDASGDYRITGLDPGSYEVDAGRKGYEQARYPQAVDVVAGQTTPGIDFALRPATAAGEIFGRVTDAMTHLPIASALVTATPAGSAVTSTHPVPMAGSAYTNAQGYYRIVNLAPGRYDMAASRDGYLPENRAQQVDVISGQSTAGVNFMLRSTNGTGGISGKVMGTAAASPLAGVMVVAIGTSVVSVQGRAMTDASGNYRILGLDPGGYEVTASKSGYTTVTYPQAVDVRSGQITPGIDFTLQSTSINLTGEIVGRVTDAETGRPVSGALVTTAAAASILRSGSAFVSPGMAYTNSEGYYRIVVAAPGSYEVTASRNGYESATYPQPVDVTPGSAKNGINFELRPLTTINRIGK